LFSWHRSKPKDGSKLAFDIRVEGRRRPSAAAVISIRQQDLDWLVKVDDVYVVLRCILQSLDDDLAPTIPR
jgi:hypothetical protein